MEAVSGYVRSFPGFDVVQFFWGPLVLWALSFVKDV